MHVYLTGATGFVGSYILRALLRQDHTVRCLLRDRSATLHIDDETDVERVTGDVTDATSLRGTMRGCDAVIHLVGIIDEQPSKGVTFERIHAAGTRHVVAEAQSEGIPRFVQMSANGARPDGVSAYQTTKWAAEQAVRAADLPHAVILRPSTIFGQPAPGQPEFCTRLVQDLIKPFPILPVFGDGSYEMQPVAVEVVAEAFVQALENDIHAGQAYCVAGQERVPYVEVLDRITKGCGLEPKRKIHQPLWLVRPAVHGLGRFGLLPISPDQFEMLVEGNTCDASPFFKAFDLEPKPFTVEHLRYLREVV